MSTEEKFRAAVNVIKSLPKNGPYQPSYELMLRFYGYYKQATEGPCTVSKPSFWEMTKKVKWEAWNRLGNMSREEAMNNYVEELKKIVETMSYTDNVAKFLGSLGDFYDSVPIEDLELLVGNVIERFRSQPGSPLSGSPLASREASPSRVLASSSSEEADSGITGSSASESKFDVNRPPVFFPPSQHSDSEEQDDEDDEEFIDTVEVEPEQPIYITPTIVNSPLHLEHEKSEYITPIMGSTDSHDLSIHPQKRRKQLYAEVNGHAHVHHLYPESDTIPERGRLRDRVRRTSIHKSDCISNISGLSFSDVPERISCTDFNKCLEITIANMQSDIKSVSEKMKLLEDKMLTRRNKWSLFPNFPIQTIVFIVGWPVVIFWLMTWLQRKHLRST